MSKTDISRYDNSWYNPGGSVVKRAFWYMVNAVFFLSPFFPFSSLKVALLVLFGAKMGRGIVIKPGVNIKYPWRLTLGNHVWIGENVWIDNLGDIVFEDNVCISQGAFLLTGNHDYKKSAFDLQVASIYLEEGAWIGANAIVCPGVRCKSHAVLAVGSVATTDLEAYSIYQGNPAVKVRERKIE